VIQITILRDFHRRDGTLAQYHRGIQGSEPKEDETAEFPFGMSQNFFSCLVIDFADKNHIVVITPLS